MGIPLAGKYFRAPGPIIIENPLITLNTLTKSMEQSIYYNQSHTNDLSCSAKALNACVDLLG